MVVNSITGTKHFFFIDRDYTDTFHIIPVLIDDYYDYWAKVDPRLVTPSVIKWMANEYVEKNHIEAIGSFGSAFEAIDFIAGGDLDRIANVYTIRITNEYGKNKYICKVTKRGYEYCEDYLHAKRMKRETAVKHLAGIMAENSLEARLIKAQKGV